MPINPEQQGHNPNDATQFAGYGCLGFILVCAVLLLWWVIKVIWGMLP